jgi:protein-S-isoprenylcysteine O-methyltransferase Ste14
VTLGIIPLLLGTLLVVKRLATGVVLDKPHGTFLDHVVKICNLFFLLVVKPLAEFDPTQMRIVDPWMLIGVELIGLVRYMMRHLLMAWPLLFVFSSCLMWIPVEEKNLLNAFGEQDDNYKQRTIR